jgi:hypothetical protein
MLERDERSASVTHKLIVSKVAMTRREESGHKRSKKQSSVGQWMVIIVFPNHNRKPGSSALDMRRQSWVRKAEVPHLRSRKGNNNQSDGNRCAS